MVYEDSSYAEVNGCDKENKDRFHIELLFSPGLYPCFQTEKERIYENRSKQKMQQQGQINKNGAANETGDQVDISRLFEH